MAEQSRSCYMCGNKGMSMYHLPTNADLRKQWLGFIFGQQPASYPGSLVVCAKHFKDSDFANLGAYNSGFATKLRINPGSVPSVSITTPQAGIVGSICKIFPSVKHVGCQTEDKDRRTVGTQLSMKTLANAFRSTGTQVKAASKNCGVCTLTFPLDSPLLLLQPTITQRPSKRPRLSLTDEEEGPSECRLSKEDQEPEDST